MNEFFRFKIFLIYQLRARTKYYLHSPFVYQFYLHVLEGNKDEPIKAIDHLRKTLRADDSLVNYQDMGTGSSSSKKISELEAVVAVRKKYGEMLYRMVKYFQPSHILELGTSVGVSTCYLALANPNTKIITVEGSPQLIETAKNNFLKLGIKNVETLCGNFDDTLPDIINNTPSLDLVVFDGNHTKEATLKYFHQCLTKAHENSIFIFDDIYWSPGMKEAWEEIKAHPQIRLTLDVYQYGICFFIKEKLAKENFVLRY